MRFGIVHSVKLNGQIGGYERHLLHTCSPQHFLDHFLLHGMVEALCNEPSLHGKPHWPQPSFITHNRIYPFTGIGLKPLLRSEPASCMVQPKPCHLPHQIMQDPNHAQKNPETSLYKSL